MAGQCAREVPPEVANDIQADLQEMEEEARAQEAWIKQSENMTKTARQDLRRLGCAIAEGKWLLAAFVQPYSEEEEQSPGRTPEFKAGNRVIIQWSACRDLNGRSGVLGLWDAASGSWTVT